MLPHLSLVALRASHLTPCLLTSDILEIGNGDFDASRSPPVFAAQARAHFTLWVVMKAVLLLGCDLNAIDPTALAIVRNPEAIAVNQDSWGQQARRISVQLAKNRTLSAPQHALVVVATAQSSRGATPRTWHFYNRSGLLYTVDGAGQAWCAQNPAPPVPITAQPCNPSDPGFAPNPDATWQLVPTTVGSQVLHRLTNAQNNDLGYRNQFGQSGPEPHTRWGAGNVRSYTNDPRPLLLLNETALLSGAGSTLQIADTTTVIDDDSIGGVHLGGDFYFDLVSGSTLETWAGELSPNGEGAARFAVALFNRSPSADQITLTFADMPGAAGAGTAARYVVREVWANVTHPISSATTFSLAIAGHDAALLVVTELA